MADLFRTLIVPSVYVGLARTVAASFGPSGVGMWKTGLSADGAEPASHYISSGYIPEAFASLLTDPASVYAAATAAGVDCTMSEIEDLFAAADISDEEPFAAMARLGVQIVSAPE